MFMFEYDLFRPTSNSTIILVSGAVLSMSLLFIYLYFKIEPQYSTRVKKFMKKLKQECAIEQCADNF